MQPLLTFACLAMCAAAAMGLLPEKSAMRSTAMLASGLLLAAMWLNSLPELAPAWLAADPPDTWLTAADAPALPQRWQMLMQQMQEEAADEQAASLAAP